MRKYKCGRYLRLSKEDELKKDESSSIASQKKNISMMVFQEETLIDLDLKK